MLTERQMMILQMVVNDYVRFAEPVGSRTISKQSELGLSAATIRNEMADLEEMGYLEQPHTSAGRIPSQRGYRFYVDHLLRSAPGLSKAEIAEIKSLFSSRIGVMERVAEQAVQILSGLSHYTGVVLGPQVYDTTLRSMQIVPIGERRSVIIVVNSSGQVHNRTVALPDGLSATDLERLISAVADRLVGTPMYKLRSRAMEEITRVVSHYMENCEEALHLLEQLLQGVDGGQDGRVYLGGAGNMLAQPEFRDFARLRPLLSWLEQPESLLDVLREDNGPALKVRIGVENETSMLRDCSVVTATYSLAGVPIGVIGVIGPTRMEYARVMQLLTRLSEGLSRAYQAYLDD